MRRDSSDRYWVREFRCAGFRNLDDASLDLLPLDGSEPWVYSDLIQNPSRDTVDPRRYCQIAVAAVVMGDLNAVYAVEAAHRRQLCRLLDPCKLGQCCFQVLLFPVLPRLGDVCI